AVVGPDRSSRARGFRPFPLFDDLRISLLDELAHPAQGLPAPVPELGDSVVDQLGCRLVHGRTRLLHNSAYGCGAPGARISAVNEPLPLPEGFAVGHWTDSEAGTGCTVLIAPPGTRGAVEVRGGGTGTREIEGLSPLANAEGPTAVLLTGGSAFGLAAADGVVRWLEERGLGRPTPVGVIPLVSTAVVFDLAAGNPGSRPGPEQGYAACEAAGGGVPELGQIGAGAGAAVGKVLGRERATQGGAGYAATRLASGETVAAIAVANSSGDVVGEDGSVLGGPRGERGRGRGAPSGVVAVRRRRVGGSESGDPAAPVVSRAGRGGASASGPASASSTAARHRAAGRRRSRRRACRGRSATRRPAAGS